MWLYIPVSENLQKQTNTLSPLTKAMPLVYTTSGIDSIGVGQSLIEEAKLVYLSPTTQSEW